MRAFDKRALGAALISVQHSSVQHISTLVCSSLVCRPTWPHVHARRSKHRDTPNAEFRQQEVQRAPRAKQLCTAQVPESSGGASRLAPCDCARRGCATAAISHPPSRRWSGGNASRLASGEGRLAAWALTTSRRLTRGRSTMGRWSVVRGLGAMAIRR